MFRLNMKYEHVHDLLDRNCSANIQDPPQKKVPIIQHHKLRGLKQNHAQGIITRVDGENLGNQAA